MWFQIGVNIRLSIVIAQHLVRKVSLHCSYIICLLVDQFFTPPSAERTPICLHPHLLHRTAPMTTTLLSYDAYDKKIKKIDSVRYFYLYHIGGLYYDMDMTCLKPFSTILDEPQGQPHSLVFADELPMSYHQDIMAGKNAQVPKSEIPTEYYESVKTFGRTTISISHQIHLFSSRRVELFLYGMKIGAAVLVVSTDLRADQ